MCQGKSHYFSLENRGQVLARENGFEFSQLLLPSGLKMSHEKVMEAHHKLEEIRATLMIW